jgi:transposase, IS5 family
MGWDGGTMSQYLRPNEGGLFDKGMRLEELPAMGAPPARLDEVMDWSLFAAVFERIPKAEPKGLGGRPAFAPAMMFKALGIANLYPPGDAQLEFQVTGRLSCKRFPGLTDADRSPDEKTFWAFRETLTRNALIEPLCTLFHEALEARGMFARQGQMVEATLVEVARQRNSREDNATIQAGGVPEGWKEQPPKARQKDVDARWTRKNGERYHGCKNHGKVDGRSQLIEDFTVTAAAVHDSQALAELIAEGAPATYVDSAYTGERCEKLFAERKVTAKPIERACRNKPLNGSQQRSNRARSKIRVRVEHVFATMRMSMRSAWNRCIGLGRNRAAIALTSLVYNMVRFGQIERLGLRNWRAA